MITLLTLRMNEAEQPAACFLTSRPAPDSDRSQDPD
jgi:hypothetical protein